MTSAQELPPLATAADYLALTGGVVDDAILAAASAAIRAYCRWHIAPRLSMTMTRDGPGGRRLLLPTLALAEVTAASQRSAAWDLDGAAVVIDLTALSWSSRGAVDLSGAFWTSRLGGIDITFTHGLESYSDLTAMVCSVAHRIWTTPTGVLSETAGSETIQYNVGGSTLLAYEQDALAGYRLNGSP